MRVWALRPWNVPLYCLLPHGATVKTRLSCCRTCCSDVAHNDVDVKKSTDANKHGQTSPTALSAQVMWNWDHAWICRARTRETRGGKRNAAERESSRNGGTHPPVGICVPVFRLSKQPFLTLFHQLLSTVSEGNTLGWLTTQYGAECRHWKHNAFSLTMLQQWIC